LVGVRAALFHEAIYNSQLPMLGGDVKGRAAFRFLADVCSKLLHETSQRSYVPMLGGHKQGETTIMRRIVGASYGLVDIGTKLFGQDSKYVQIAQLGRNAQRLSRNHPDA
jgi:hypothetical protein